MIFSKSYKRAFLLAISLHVFLLLALLIDKTVDRPVLNKSENAHATAIKATPVMQQEKQAIKAVSVDSDLVMQEVNRLKEERARQQQLAIAKQNKIKKDAEIARKKLLAEQKRVNDLKKEAEKLAIAKQKELLEAKKRKQAMDDLKKTEEKKLAAIKKQQQDAQEKRDAEVKRLAAIKAEKIKAEIAKEEQLAASQAAKKAMEEAAMAGVIDKYKAMIINAISREWILPENANSSMSSQFRIRLAPNGAVLEVSLVRSSGDDILDRSARAAIYKASPLPVPSDPAAFNIFRDISLTVRPNNARG